MRLLLVGMLSLLSATGGSALLAEPMEYVRVCDAYGVGFYYIPGTETCLRPDTGEMRTDTENGTVATQSTLAERLGYAISGIAKANTHIAISNALQDPDLVAGERFGLRLNWGTALSEHAFGLSGAVVLSDDLFDSGRGRLTGSGGFAFSGGEVGGRAGLQLTW